MKRICVFCGSNPGANPQYVQTAKALGRVMAEKSLGLVYGGASVGMMGEIADAVLQAKGEVIGVIPKFLVDKEVSHKHLTDLRVVNSMHERKMLMADLADGFIALPGGLGTIEEFFEVVTWAQLGMHGKPCGLLNVAGYFRMLVEFLEHAVQERLIRAEHRSMILMDENPGALLEKFDSYQPPVVEKWMDRKP
ncbi:MAG: TIGR00730 family Rossman fold protein [Desulfobacteraceae bacterium]|nr:TIGR00730 family Rossman fold protein [Desulfobacteraceae bacterium]MBU4053783.1 TIGR00730 family Rossman fold protein [Pseudomonadota bacterium]